MKVVINKTGKTEDVSLKLGQRLINKGKAHKAKNISVTVPLKVIQKKEKLKDFTAELKIGEAISEPSEEIKVEVGEIGELAEPIEKPKKRSRKKKSEFKEWDID